MPELPEVETIRRQLQAVLPGKTIKTVTVMREKSGQGDVQSLVGKTIRGVGRKQKMLMVEFDDETIALLIHLKMTGQLIYQDQERRVFGGHPTPDWVNDLPSKHTRVIVGFRDGSILYFNDQRVFGWWRVVLSDELREMKGRLPPDVIDPEFTALYLQKVLKTSQRPVKLVLLDQAKIGGLGNIYINDALWLARTKPTRKAASLTRKEIEVLHAASVQVIQRGIETGGASESTYKHISGLGGKYQEEFLVYKREGEPCLRQDEGMIKKISLGGRGTYFCPVCQK